MYNQRQSIKAQRLAEKQDQLKDREEVRRIVREQLLEHLEGEGFWDDFKEGFMSVIKPVASVAKNVASFIPHPVAQGVSGALGALGAGRDSAVVSSENAKPVVKKAARKRLASAALQKRNALVKQLMNEQGMSLPDASRHIKKHSLL